MKGKRTFRPVYVRSLHGLNVADRVELLRKVSLTSYNASPTEHCHRGEIKKNGDGGGDRGRIIEGE
jgi:hypothetical protein